MVFGLVVGFIEQLQQITTNNYDSLTDLHTPKITVTDQRGMKRQEVGELHNEELHNLYSSPSIIRIIKSRRIRWARHLARMGKKRNAYRILVGKPEGKRPMGRPRPRWVDHIKIYLRETVWGGLD
jgi:hypothetical protein